MDLMQNATLADLESLRFRVTGLIDDQQETQKQIKQLEIEHVQLTATTVGQRETLRLLKQELATVNADPSLINYGKIYTPVIVFGVVVVSIAATTLSWLLGAILFGNLIATLISIPAGGASHIFIKRILVPHPYLSPDGYQTRVLGVDSELKSLEHQNREIVLALQAASDRLTFIKVKLKSYPSIKKIDELVNAKRIAVEEKDRRDRERLRLANANWREYRGIEFENFFADVMRLFKFTVRTTKTSGDQGVDLVAVRDRETVAIQCKGYSGAVGNSAVQQVHAGKVLYGCHVSWCVTNSSFTRSARELALSVSCLLIDGNDIQQILSGQKAL